MKDKDLQAIREKHSKEFGKRRCQYCFEPFPCDVAKVLDYFDEPDAVKSSAWEIASRNLLEERSGNNEL